MSPQIHRFFMILAIALAAASVQLKARAAPLADADAQQVQAVIAGQLQAFATQDADAAFAAITPEVRDAIGSAPLFLALVRGHYPMFSHPVAVAFLEPELQEGQALQAVTLRDEAQRSWVVLFALEQQPDNSWRIGGCVVAEDDTQTS